MITEKPLTQLTHEYLACVIRPGDKVVDATVGNGHDTLFLARAVNPGGVVYGFDIQGSAIRKTQALIEQAGLERVVRLVNGSHEAMTESISADHRGKISAIVYNLGYLPGGDHELTTMAETTVESLTEGFSLLQPGAVLSVMCYPGHPEGARELVAVERWAEQLGQLLDVEWLSAPTERRRAPRLLFARKKKGAP